MRYGKIDHTGVFLPLFSLATLAGMFLGYEMAVGKYGDSCSLVTLFMSMIN